MTSSNKELLLAKIDIFYQSVGDPQLQTVIALLRDLAANVEISDKGELGFGSNNNGA